MTEKELLYVEDAFEHEKSIIQIISDNLNSLKDTKLLSFMKNQISIHEDRKNKLMSLLEENANE